MTALTCRAGKTLALLCAVAEWQWRVKQAALEEPCDLPPDQQLRVPRIVWGARTHAQLDHAIRELRCADENFMKLPCSSTCRGSVYLCLPQHKPP